MPNANVNMVQSSVDAVDGEDVVAATTQATLDIIGIPGLSVPVNAFPSSPLPDGTGLGGPVAINALTIIQAAAATAEQQNNKPRPRASVPTADFVHTGSFKTGSKFMIRVVPNATGKPVDTANLDQITDDAAMYFEKASLQSTNEVREERFQIFEAFDAETVFLFGERPKVWNYQFIVANGQIPIIPANADQATRDRIVNRYNLDFCDDLVRRYELYYRGTKAITLRARVFLSYENTLIEATLVGMSISKQVMMPSAVPIGLTFVVHNVSFMGEGVGDTSDATLAGLLDSQARADFTGQQLAATSIVQPSTTTNQLLTQQAQAQADNAASQTTMMNAANELKTADESIIDAEATRDAATNELSQVQAQLVEETDPAKQAELMQQAQSLQETIDFADSQASIAFDIVTAAQDDLDEAVSENMQAISAQDVTTAALKNSTAGDLSQTTQQPTIFVDRFEKEGDGSITITTFQVDSDDDANAIAAGVDPSTLGFAKVISSVPAPKNSPGSGSRIRHEVRHV